MMKLLVLLVGVLVCASQKYDFETGNKDLKMAMDVAAVESHDRGVWDLVIAREEGVSLPLYCSWNRTLVRYPTPQSLAPDGTLENILKTEEIIFGYVNASLRVKNENGHTYDALDTTHPQPTGLYTLWHVSLVQQLGIAYGKLIQLRYKTFSTPESTLNALRNGEIHMAITPWDLSGNFGGRRELSFLLGCPDHSKGQGRLFVDSNNDRFESMNIGAFFASQASASPVYKIGALNNAECSVYKSLYFQSEVTCVETPEELSTGLSSGAFDLVSQHLVYPTLTVALPGAPPSVAYYGSLYRQDECVE